MDKWALFYFLLKTATVFSYSKEELFETIHMFTIFIYSPYSQ